MATEIQFEILEDGQVKITTDKIANAHHTSADQLLDELEKMLGGPRVTNKRDVSQARRVHHHKNTVKHSH